VRVFRHFVAAWPFRKLVLLVQRQDEDQRSLKNED